MFRVFCYFAACVALCYLVLNTNTWSASNWASASQDNVCDLLPNTKGLVFTVKVDSTSDTNTMLRRRLLSDYQCIDQSNILFVADSRLPLGSHQVNDVLDKVDLSVRSSHPDFQAYRRQRVMLSRNSRSLVPLTETTLGSDPNGLGSRNHEKYMQLHMIEHAWRSQPDQDWYIFADSSTHFVTMNLVFWLRARNESVPTYIGLQPWDDNSDIKSARLGDGIILSGAAVKALMSQDGLARSWDKQIENFASGDNVLSHALRKHVGLELSDAWPQILGRQLSLLPFNSEYMNETLLSLRSFTPSDESDLLRVKQLASHLASLDPPELLTYAHLVDGNMLARSAEPLEYWDNLSADSEADSELDWQSESVLQEQRDKNLAEIKGDESFDACSKLCARFSNCVQYSYMRYTGTVSKMVSGEKTRIRVKDGGMCHLSAAFRAGQARDMNTWEEVEDVDVNGRRSTGVVFNTQLWSSGWVHDRIVALRSPVVSGA